MTNTLIQLLKANSHNKSVGLQGPKRKHKKRNAVRLLDTRHLKLVMFNEILARVGIVFTPSVSPLDPTKEGRDFARFDRNQQQRRDRFALYATTPGRPASRQDVRSTQRAAAKAEESNRKIAARKTASKRSA
jgi:dipeptidyl aminopeptidase/acylaminoacyl peptidase